MTRPAPAAGRGRSFRRAAAGACLSASLVILPLAMAPAAHAETAPVGSAPVAVEAPAVEAPAVETPAATPTPAVEAPAADATPTPAPTETADETAPVADAPVETTPTPAVPTTPGAPTTGLPTLEPTVPVVELPFTWTTPDRGVALPINEAVPFAGTGTAGSIVTASYFNAVGVKSIAGIGIVGEDGTYAFPASFTELLQDSKTASVTLTQVGLDLTVKGEIRGLVRFAEAPVGPFVRAEASFSTISPISVAQATSILGGLKVSATGYLRYEAVEVTVTAPDGSMIQISDENGGVGVSTRSLKDLVRADVDGTFAQPIILFGDIQPGTYQVSVAGLESGLTQGGTVELTGEDAGGPVIPGVPTPTPTTPSIDPAGTAPKPIAKPAAHHDDTLPVTGTDGAAALGLGGLGALLALAGAGTLVARRRMRSAE
ncbi:LPXTG cell wall anchor domain-containing protein [Clavibacter sp. VKM Ac-2542]|uniref:LPXTG cell wall anchor domain-containing protein n=1 Tax=Clavibacter sp. VKM Ac-2542 TaxID=2783811 RepID=UPI00188A49C9|nr:LPXTG cell wall anchor domain-containing protein [Clavibacter sp. VKM Ac-2542]MBF4621325.1 LPXTG cell wall anchor domain-containing protein [Clavibacter sp. VKM Ac-2542]